MIGYSTCQVATILGVTRSRIDNLRKSGQVGPLDAVGKTLVYRPSDVVKVAGLLGVEVPGFKETGK